jgi:hypothetical protein
MYTRKNELISRLVEITGNSRGYFVSKTVMDLNAMLECYDSKEKRTYLEVPYKEKEIAKLLGAKFDGAKKRWYIPIGAKSELFDKWIKQSSGV